MSCKGQTVIDNVISDREKIFELSSVRNRGEQNQAQNQPLLDILTMLRHIEEIILYVDLHEANEKRLIRALDLCWKDTSATEEGIFLQELCKKILDYQAKKYNVAEKFDVTTSLDELPECYSSVKIMLRSVRAFLSRRQ